jgi:trehalose 6-phosphate phosphatase
VGAAALEAVRERLACALVCADFDGTLAQIVDHPSGAVPLPGAVETLSMLARRCRCVAMVSGRPVADLFERVGLEGIVYTGLYGMETREVGGCITISPEGQAAAAAIHSVRKELEAALAREPGAVLEDKGLTLAAHFRLAPDPGSAGERVRQVVADLALRHGLAVAGGRMVWELVPAGAVDKGRPILRLVEAEDAGAVLFAGDDVGDQAAFRALDEIAARGIPTCKVAVSSTEGPPGLLEEADIVVDGPQGALELLRSLIVS